jgi:hypothetical protein
MYRYFYLPKKMSCVKHMKTLINDLPGMRIIEVSRCVEDRSGTIKSVVVFDSSRFEGFRDPLRQVRSNISRKAVLSAGGGDVYGKTVS